MKKRKQYYKIHIDPKDILTEEELHEQIYGDRKLTPFENIGLELSYGYFNYWLVLIITIVSLIFGILIGSVDASRRFNLPISEVLSLNPSKSELALSSVDYSRQVDSDKTCDSNTEIQPDKFNLDGFTGTINMYYGDVQIGDVIEGSYSSYTNKDNQYVDVKNDDSTVLDTQDDSKKDYETVDYETTQSVDDSDLNDDYNYEDTTAGNSESPPQDTDIIESDKTLNEYNTYSGHKKEIVLNISKVSNDTVPEDYSDNEEFITIGASDQDTKDNTDVGEELPSTRPSELEEYQSDECIIGASTSLLEDFDDSSPKNSNNLVVIPLWCEVLRNLFYVLTTIVIILWIKKYHMKM